MLQFALLLMVALAAAVQHSAALNVASRDFRVELPKLAGQGLAFINAAVTRSKACADAAAPPALATGSLPVTVHTCTGRGGPPAGPPAGGHARRQKRGASVVKHGGGGDLRPAALFASALQAPSR